LNQGSDQLLNESRSKINFPPGKKYRQGLFVAVVILLSMWQISLFQYTLKWDAMDITMPWRYFTADALLHGILPWWNPYQFQGFAQGLSLETWYPLAILLGLAKGYGLYSLNLEYLFHLLIAGYGFYKLARLLGIHHQGALWGSLVFPLSGFFVGNAQHMGWIASGAWAPHVIAGFVLWKQHANLKNGASLIFFSFCLLTGGYMAFSIILLYVLAIMGIIHLYQVWKYKGPLGQTAGQFSRLVFCAFWVFSIVLVSVWQLKEEIDRGQGLSGDALMKGSYYLKHLVSLIFPFATVKGNFELWTGDQSMMNAYMGLSTMILLVLSLKKLNQFFYRFWWIIGISSLSLALAVELPFRGWLNILPMFDLFRFPSLFRYFFILALVIIASKMIGDHPYNNDDGSRLRKHFINGGLILLAISSVSFIACIPKQYDGIQKIAQLSIDTVREAITLQSAVHIVSLLLLIIGSELFRKRVSFFRILIFFTALDLFVSAQLNGRVSVFSEESFESVNTCLERLPQGYPIPPMNDLLGSNSDNSLHVGPVYRNTNTLYKRIGRDGYTPYQYQRFIAFEKTPYYQTNLNRPFVYAARVLEKKAIDGYETQYTLSPAQAQLTITSFDPNHVEVSAQLEIPATLVLNQNKSRGWRVFVNDRELPLEYVDLALMGIPISSGHHTVRFVYDPGRSLHALAISFIALFLCLSIYFWFNRKSALHGVILLICLSQVLYRSWNKPTSETISVNHQYPIILNAIDQLQVEGEIHYEDRFFDGEDFGRFKQVIDNLIEPYTYITKGICAGTPHLYKDYIFENALQIDSSTINGLLHLVVTPHKKALVFLSKNNFENLTQGWTNQTNQLISRNGNTFQSLNNQTYSTTLLVDLEPLEKEKIGKIRIEVDHQNTGALDASIICSLEAEDGTRLFWKSFKLEDASNPYHWRNTSWILYPGATVLESAKLGVYIWNVGNSDLSIDNFSVELSEAQGD